MNGYQTRLYDIREEKNLTQKEVADLLRVSRQNYSFWEIGYKFIPLKHLNNYCNIFNVSMDYVFKLTDSKTCYKLSSLDKKQIGNNLSKFMKENKITQNTLAADLNTTQSTISAYKNGKTLILTAFLYQIATKYNTSMDKICGRKN